MKKFLWIPVIFLLCSCGGGKIRGFVEPTDGDRARIRMVGNAFSVYAIPGRSCINRRTPGAGPVPVFGFYFYAKAGEPITLVVGGPGHITGTKNVCSSNDRRECDFDANGVHYCYDVFEGGECYDVDIIQYCSTGVTFIPEKDVDYEAAYSEKSWENCDVDVYPIGAHQGELVNVRTAPQRCPRASAIPALEAFANERYFLQTPAMLDPSAPISDEIRNSCSLGKRLGNYTQSAIRRYLHSIQSVSSPEEAGTDKVIQLTIISAHGTAGSILSGAKSISIRVDILKEGVTVSSTILNRSTQGRLFGRGMFGETLCTALDRVTASLGRDVAGWLLRNQQPNLLNQPQK